MDILTRQNAVETPENTIQTDSGCETIEETVTTTISNELSTSQDQVLVLRADPESNKRIVNKTEYAKLHRSLSPTRQLDSIKAKYEIDKKETKNRSKLPIPKSRLSIKSELIIPQEKTADKSKYRHSLILDRKSKKKDENSNEIFRKSSSSSGEFITIVRRSESIETVDKLEKELDLFTMDNKKVKDKKRHNSFRRIFTGKIFTKEKKKKEEDRKNINSDNIQNENNAFSRQSPYRENSNIPKPTTRIPQREERRLPAPIDMEKIEKQYAQMHVQEFNNIKQNFENKPLTPNTPLPTVNPGPMDFKKVANINRFIDTSCSSTESDRENSIKYNQETENPYRSLRFADGQRNTPPRAQELRQIQDVKLVNPKALIPINSERPLPNPYQNTPSNKPKPQNFTHFNYPEQPVFDETYGTVFDSLESRKEQKLTLKPPRSPSLEPSKLRLPSNRDIGPASPRMKSPIPQHHVSAEKLIATELLRNSRSPTPTKKRPNQLNLNQQRSEVYSDNNQTITGKPPIISRNNLNRSGNYQARSTEYINVQPSRFISSQEKLIPEQVPPRIPQRHSQISPISNSDYMNQVRSSPMNGTMRSPTPNVLMHHNPELSAPRPHSSRSSTPVDLRIPQTSKQSPQKEEMRKSVEAYYWKEIKKLKEIENRDLYYYQVQYMPFGYAEEPISVRRSRSSSPSQRNGRRSLSLPREQKQQITEVDYGRFQPIPIPEGRAVIDYNTNYQNLNFRRNTPERRTIDSVPRNGNNSVNRPIFKRGSLTAPTREVVVEDPQYKKVSFGTQGVETRPPKRESLEDDVFLPNSMHTTKLIVDGKEIYGYVNKPLESPYYQNANFYHRQLDPSIKGDPRYGSIQLPQHQRVSRRMSFDTTQSYVQQPLRRQIYVKDDVYGYFGEYVPVDQQNVIYTSKQNVNEPVYGYSRDPSKQITVRDKVCDMYGQIHDRNSPSLNVRKTGVILGQVTNQNFVRNSRLTASANDMYNKRQQHQVRYAVDVAPSRPLPPVPDNERKVFVRQVDRNVHGFGDNEMTDSKKRSVFENANPQEQSNSTFLRLILLEQLHLLKRQAQLEIQKREWLLKQNKLKPKDRCRIRQLETKSTENISTADLKKRILLEELQLIQFKINLELFDFE